MAFRSVTAQSGGVTVLSTAADMWPWRAGSSLTWVISHRRVGRNVVAGRHAVWP